MEIYHYCAIVVVACAMFYGVAHPSVFAPNGAVYVGANGHELKLINNESARDVTYAEVLEFIKIDQTDSIEYNPGVFTCGDYAELVQNNAEDAGIRCAWVGIDFEGNEPGHACNAFNTTDKGLVFIDCTTSDNIVDLQDGKEYAPNLIWNSDDYTVTPMGIVKDYDIHWK